MRYDNIRPLTGMDLMQALGDVLPLATALLDDYTREREIAEIDDAVGAAGGRVLTPEEAREMVRKNLYRIDHDPDLE